MSVVATDSSPAFREVPVSRVPGLVSETHTDQEPNDRHRDENVVQYQNRLTGGRHAQRGSEHEHRNDLGIKKHLARFWIHLSREHGRDIAFRLLRENEERP